MRFNKLRMAAVAAALASVAALGAWAIQDDHTHPESEYVFSHLRARSHSADVVWFESSLAEMVPSQRFSVNNGPARALTKGLVIGHVTDVREGQGFAHPDDAPSSTQVGFDSPDALWRTVEVTVAVEEAWGDLARNKEVTFAVIIDRGADASAAINGLRSLDQVIVSLDRLGRYAYAPDLYSISHSGDLFGTIDNQGNIQLPVMEHGAEFMNGLDTVAEVRAAARQSPPVVRIDMTDGVPVRR